MTSILNELSMYFSFPFVRYAFIVGVLVALCSSLLGVTLVLKRFSFIGSGLSHVAFGATAIAAAMSFTNNMLIALPITIAAAILLLRSGQNAKIKGDAALAMISVGSLSIGYLLLNLFPSSANLAGDICEVLFGALAIITLSEPALVWTCVILSAIVIIVFILFYNKIFAVTFDEDFATATGVRAKAYNLLLAVVVAVIIVMAMNLVGALLVSALVVFPALTAMRVFKSFRAVTICSVIASVVCAALGIIISILTSTPVGSTIVAANIAVFAVFSLIGLIMRR
jgi:zinc transport system permease protein